MINMNEQHTFVICAYKESPYLEKCIHSLLKQSIKTRIIMVTSTPNDFVQNMAEKYQISLYINEGEGGITQDWNFGYSKADTSYITIAHQDDVYHEKYAEHVLGALVKAKHPLIAFTDYYEVRNDKIVKKTKMLNIKRLMLFSLRLKFFHKSRFVRRRILSLGCPICCPSVTFAANNITPPVFVPGYRSCEDWQAWEKLSRKKGEFVFVNSSLMMHRIHEDSETSAIIDDNARSLEDYEMFCKFWPKWFAKIIVRFYSVSQKSNNLEKGL